MTNNIRLTEELIPVVREKLSGLTLPYTAVHLRGTDRLNAETLKGIRDEYDELPPHIKARVFIVSDMKRLCEIWEKAYAESSRLDDNPCIYKLPSGAHGTHMYEEEALEFYGVNKRELNINTIVDFLTIAYANWAYGNSESVFLQMGKFVRQTGVKGVSNWLNGFIPPRAALAAKP
jgi:hypothetical protein